MASRHVFRGRARFHPACSILGRLYARLIDDERRAEAAYLMAASTTAAIGAIGAMAAASIMDISGADLRQFWFWPWTILGLVLAICLVGFAPGVEVHADKEGLGIRQGRRRHAVPFTDIAHSQVISALVYYRNYALYSDTARFMAHIPKDVLVLTVGDQHVAIGLDSASHAELDRLIQKKLRQSVRTGVSHQFEYGV